MNKKLPIFLALLCVLALTVPSLAEARAGGGGSSGSRGSMTHQSMPSSSAYQAQPITRSATARPQYGTARPQAAPMAAPSLASSPSFFGAHPFLSSMAGGFLGAGLFSALFGHSANAGVAGVGDSTGGGMGGLLPLLLIGGLIFLAVRWYRNNNAQMGSVSSFAPTSFAPLSMPQQDTSFGGSNDPITQTTPLPLIQTDYQSFESLLEKIQASWSQGDLAHLRQFLTPEMLGYFNENLSTNSSRGLANKVEQVKMISGDLIEAWSENDMDYATVHMKWNAIDCMTRLDKEPTDADYVAEGSLTVPTEAAEIWTFARAPNGGHWLLSAIQQVA